uniref:Zinc finger matrin-type protein 5 n=1 Tax=Anser cygnoides TaxID=8845 RepID=A0A8B9DP21_ANSCY
MGKRYFCDYCDRSFQDNLHNRKKHLNGVQHLRAKRAWYDLFRDAAAILQEEQSKKPCRKFLQTGQCDFGSNCRFSHMTEQDLEKLSAQVQAPCLRNQCPSSTRRAGRRRRSCPRPCRPPRPGGGRCPLTCSGAEAPCWGWTSPSPEKGSELLTYAFVLIKFSPPPSQPRVISRLAASGGSSWSPGVVAVLPKRGAKLQPRSHGCRLRSPCRLGKAAVSRPLKIAAEYFLSALMTYVCFC